MKYVSLKPGFSRAFGIEKELENGYILTNGKYVGFNECNEPFEAAGFVKCLSDSGPLNKADYLTTGKIYTVIDYALDDKNRFQFIADNGVVRYGSLNTEAGYFGKFTKFPEVIDPESVVLDVDKAPKTISYFGLELQLPLIGLYSRWLYISENGLVIFSKQKPKWDTERGCYNIIFGKDDWYSVAEFKNPSSEIQKASLVEISK